MKIVFFLNPFFVNFLSLLILATTSMLYICQMLFYVGLKLKFTNNHGRGNHEGCPYKLTLVCLENNTHASRPLISATVYCDDFQIYIYNL